MERMKNAAVSALFAAVALVTGCASPPEPSSPPNENHARNRLVVIPGTGHTYQGKAKDAAIQVANKVRDLDRG